MSEQKTISKKARNSNLELLRIILMLLIISHHMVVNSGVTGCYDFTGSTANTIFYQLFGMWGKPAINAFVMISGYFMCTSRLTVKRYFKLWVQVKFYRVLIYAAFLITGYTAISAKGLIKVAFGNLISINNGFTASFLAFYLFIPFYNILIKNLNRKQHGFLIGSLLLVFTVSATFFDNSNVFHFVGWYMTLYFVAAYIRLYPAWWSESRTFSGICLLITVLLSYMSVLLIDFADMRFGMSLNSYYFVSDSNKIFALLFGLFIFLWFKNISVPQSKLINSVGGTTFGILLIHAGGDNMRTFLWKDLLNITEKFDEPLIFVIGFSFLSVVCIFIVCSVIDLVRIHAFEKPLFRLVDKHESAIASKAEVCGTYIGQRLNALDEKAKNFFTGGKK